MVNNMNPIKDNKDIACFHVTKHSNWKGNYRRIFSIGSLGISTYNPKNLEVTNRWVYSDIINIKAAAKPMNNFDFSLTMKKDKKTDTMKFSCDHTTYLLTEALKYSHLFAEKPKKLKFIYSAYKYHWSDTRLPTVLEVTPYSLDQLEPTTNHVIASYCYKDLEGIAFVSDCVGGFVVVQSGFGRLHMFSSEHCNDICNKMFEHAQNFFNISIKTLQIHIKTEHFQSQRFGKLSGDEHLTSVSEFLVSKINSVRHRGAQRRLFCLTDSCVIERDLQTYNICTLRPLNSIFALIRDDQNPQLFSIEYNDAQVRTYISTDRDSLLASLLDGVRAAGNRDVHVKMLETPLGKRLSPLGERIDEETEIQHLKFLQQPPNIFPVMEVIIRFNANVPYSGLLYYTPSEGLFSENKDKVITSALQTLVNRDLDQMSITNAELEQQFQALRRLVAGKVGFAAFTSLQGFREAVGLKVVSALRRDNCAVTHAAIDMLCALMHSMHDEYDLRHEQLNKASLLSNNKFLDNLLNMWIKHITHSTGALVVSAMLDFLTFGLCVPYSETTDGTYFDNLLEMVAARGRSLFKLFQHPSMAIVKGVGLIMRALIEEGDEQVAERMQDLALAEGALPRHLLAALYTQVTDSRMLTHRQLSRHLVGLWVTEHSTAIALLKRIFPSGLYSFLDSLEQVPANVSEQEMLLHRDNLKIAQQNDERSRNAMKNWQTIDKSLKLMEKHMERALQHWGVRLSGNNNDKLKERPVVLRKRRERVKSQSNWSLFYYKFSQDHQLPNLIWNHKTREELRLALENEIRMLECDQQLAAGQLVAWNYHEFEVHYQCLADEIKIGDYYLRLLLEMGDALTSSESPIRKCYEFFNELYHRYLLSNNVDMKCICLQAMSIVYSRYYEDIGSFTDTKNIIQMLERCQHRTERDRLVTFISKLILHKRNVKEIIEANGCKILVELATLAHLHTSRAPLPTQSNVIESSSNQNPAGIEQEWYCHLDDNDRKGPLTFNQIKELHAKGILTTKTKCWAKCIEGWRTPNHIPQLKWTLFAKGQAVFNETELATLILNILIKMCQYYPSRDMDDAVIRPIPRVKRLLSDSLYLPYIVQLLLTFDPIIVEKVACLLCELMQDNPEVTKLYMTGVFFFILMYTGSNLLPIAKFLAFTHMKQAFRSDDVSSDIMQQSILGQLLPEAMIHYLENHGADKFAQIFLGEFDTPEVIWNSQMRRLLIEKIACHICDFTPRLKCNIMVRYDYMTLPAIRYPQLEHELFCNIYYLRHLCDTIKFPDWPIAQPVNLLKDVLDAWREEVEKKPPSMTLEEAYTSLDLPVGQMHDEAVLRKAYYKLAQKFHPDKNPQGRERFVKVKKAYEFLCSRSCWAMTDGPNPNNINLILKTQSILFDKYSTVLEPYKYAGYPQLIKTIQMETIDDQLFSKDTPLLPAASELIYFTVRCSALNAEELRREKGLEMLLDALSRCVSILNKSSRSNEVSVQVCENITRCYSVAAQFASCRERIVQLPQLVVDICRIIYFKHLTKLCAIATECIEALATDSLLQMQLFKAGALWHLISFMFSYDYTLDDGGVESHEATNQQEVSNKLAKLAVKALAKLSQTENTNEQIIKECLCSLLTSYVANKLNYEQPEQVLKLLNSNSETPYLIWENSARIELSEFLHKLCKNQNQCDLDEVIDKIQRFKFKIHQNELIIGDIYIRVYNEQPTYEIQEPNKFSMDLLEYLKEQMSYLSKMENIAFSLTLENRIKHTLMTLEALKNLIQNNTGVEQNCKDYFKMLFSMLNIPNAEIQKSVLNVILLVTRNNECVQEIARSEVLVNLLLVLYTLSDSQLVILEILFALASTTQIVKQALAKGAVIYLLDLFCNSNNSKVRILCAQLLAKMCCDKLVGPRIRLALEHFLPAVFADAMRDNPETCLHMFETEHEHPELIWNTEGRERISQHISNLRKEFQNSQLDNVNIVWKVPELSTENMSPLHSDPREIVVAGVYLRLFIANPSWTLRKPKQFLSELLNTCLNSMSKDKIQSDYLEMVTNALCALLQCQPSLADQVPALGHIPRICRHMCIKTKETQIHKCAILILHQLSKSDICVDAISQSDCMQSFKVAMEMRADMIGVACEALNRLFTQPMIGAGQVTSNAIELLVKQALDNDIVNYLLGLLQMDLELLDNPSATKAQIVKALKSMQCSQFYGAKVTSILDRSDLWAQYKNQRHDLFISNIPIAGYITGGSSTTAGYLTQGHTRSMNSVPPPPTSTIDQDFY